MLRTTRHWLLLLLGSAALVLVAIAAFSVSPPAVIPTPMPITPRLVFIPTPPTAKPPTAVVTPSQIAPTRVGTTHVDLNALAPPGPQRDMLFFECSNCHSFACAFRGQRTLGHWEMVRLTHVEHGWVRLSDDDLTKLFDYLEINFNDEKPEPIFPPALADQGCTTPPLR